MATLLRGRGSRRHARPVVIERIVNDGGGVSRPFGDMRRSAREFCYTINFALRVLEQKPEPKPEPEPKGKPGHFYQPKTGAKCSCRPGIQRDNCPNCEGTGMVIDFAAIRARA